MCVLTIKRDENMNPDHAKARIVVLGNLESRCWQKSKNYAPVLQCSSLRLLASMATESRRVLKQGDCKNGFCNAKLPDDEVTIIKPPSGDPDSRKDVLWLLKKTLCGLGRSPRHWHKMINSIFVDMGSSQASTTHASARASRPPKTHQPTPPTGHSTLGCASMTWSTTPRTPQLSAASKPFLRPK